MKTTRRQKKDPVANFFAQMMFVSGETAEASAETTTLIEEIVRQQVIEMVSTMAAKPYSPSDLK